MIRCEGFQNVCGDSDELFEREISDGSLAPQITCLTRQGNIHQDGRLDRRKSMWHRILGKGISGSVPAEQLCSKKVMGADE